MVRETRHLWVGNLPHTIREERILDHFKRYGKVQSVKILPKKDEEGGGGTCATVAFIDIKSAAKAHNADNKIDERTLKTDYYEPPASSTASSAIFIHERDDALVVRNPAPPPPPTAYATSRNARYGLPEDRNYERPGHYYERVADRESYLRRSVGMGYHDEDSYQGRGKSRDRYVRSASGSTYAEGTERNQNHFRAHNTRQIFEQTRYSEQYNEEREVGSTTPRLNRRTNNASTASVVSSVASSPPPRSESRPRRSKRRSPSQTPSASRSNSMSRSRSRSSSGSRSSSSSSKLRSSSSDSSDRSWSPSKSRSPLSSYGNQSNAKRLDRPASAIANPSTMTSYLPSSISTSSVNCTPSLVNSQNNASTHSSSAPTVNDSVAEKDEKKPLGICVRNLPVRSTDTSLKDGLFHEYKKHGKVTMVKVIGQGTERYAVVCFKKSEDVEKALEVSKDKQFFGCKIEVTAHEGLDADDNEFRPLEAELDEYHPKATRTLFIGNLEKDITTAELRKHFEQFGEIIEIDIKKQGSATSYAFIQYSDIASVVKAMRKLDGENLGANRIKLGFGKSMPTNCVWLDGIVDTVTEKYLARHFSRYGLVAYCAVDWEKGHALIFYDSVEFAQIAVGEMRGRIIGGKKLQVDFASRECQTTFFDKLEMTGQMVPGDRPWERRDRRGAEFDIVRADDRDSRVGFDRVYTRYEGQTRSNRGNFRGVQRTGFGGRGRGQNFSNRYEMYYDEFGERRHRYSSREESGGESSTFDNKIERLKYGEPVDCNNRKRNKLRNSISDQESHHSQSPPRSRHQSRSTSPVSKDRKSLKDRLHHRIKSPGSHNSSQVSSPCRESTTEEPSEVDFKELKNSDGKMEVCDSDANFSVSCPKNSLLHDGLEKIHPKADGDPSRRKSTESETFDESSSTSEQLSQLERKRRLLAAAASLNKDGTLVIPKSSGERFKLKNSVSHSTQNKLGQVNCVSDSVADEKSDAESGELHEESVKEKLHSGESANTDLKYLQKKQVHLLHLLEQLHEGVNSSDTDGSVDSDRFSRKKKRSLSSCMENMYNESDITKAITKDECSARLIKSGLKDPISLTKSLSKNDSVDSNNCFSLSLDSFVFRKHLDPRRVDHYTLSSLPKGRRISLDKEEQLLPNNQAGGDSYICMSSNISSDVSWKKQCSEGLVSNCDADDATSMPTVRSKIKEEPGDTCVSSKKLFSSSDLAKSLTGRTFPDSPLEIKRERDISPLSLPLPKFAASLRSPKSSPSVLTSPRSVAQSPRLVHSPNPHGCGKGIKVPDVFLDIHHDRKAREPCLDEKLNGINISSSASSPSESHLQLDVSDITCLETIQSPKNNSERCKEITVSSDSDLSPISSPNRPSIEDRIKALDERYNAWSGSTRSTGSAAPDASPTTDLPKCSVKRSRFNFLASELRTEPSDIVKSLLSKSTIFDQDSMRLQHIDEKYEPLNVKMDLSPKVKPTFRTKAAAKEFSPTIAPPLPAFSTAVHSKTSLLASQGITSPLDTPQSAISNDVLPPVTPPTQQHLSQVPSQLYTPCVTTSFSTTKETDDNSFPVVDNLPGDNTCLTSKVYNSVKVKCEPDAASSIENVPHSILTTSLPVSVKKEPLFMKENIQPVVNDAETLCPVKKEPTTILEPSIPPSKDYPSGQLKDQILYKNLNLCEHDHSGNFCDSCNQWKESESMDEVSDVAKTLPTLGSSDLKLVTPAVKKRVSSIDSSESESGKSYKSSEFSRESHDVTWSKVEKDKHESKALEPECKKSKLSSSRSDQNRSPTPVPMSTHRKSEKKEKSSKSDKSKSSTSRKASATSVSEKEDSDVKSIRNESRDKPKADTHKSKEDKKNRPREHKETTTKSDSKNKSCEKRNSDKDKENQKSSSSNARGKKEHAASRSEKTKTDKKTSEKKTSKPKLKYEIELPLDEVPVYFSMYDKVKARSSKQQTMKHQAKDLETVRQKFSKLKQSRAKKEEKSKSVDSDKDSDSGSQLSSDSETKTSKAKQQRKRKLVIESSSDDETPQDSQNRNNRSENKDYTDSASDSDFDQKLHHKQPSSSRSRKKKTDVIESDSSDSSSQKAHMVGKKKLKSRNSLDKNKKALKSDGEGSDVEMIDKAQTKEKEYKRKKIRKSKNHDNKSESEAPTSTNVHKKGSEETKVSRKKSHKDDKQHSDSSVAARLDESNKDKTEREKKTGNDTEQPMDVENLGKFKSFTRKKKKAKKASRSKEKRMTSVRRSSEFTNRKDDESESKSSLPVLLSPRPSSPASDKPLSPPCLKAGDASDNDIKSDFSDDDFDVHQSKNADIITTSERNSTEAKVENISDCSNSKSSRKKESIFSPTKLHSELFDSDHEEVLTTFSEKSNKSLHEKEQCNKGSTHTVENSRKKMPQSSSIKKNRETSSDGFHQKTKHDKNSEICTTAKHNESKSAVDRSYNTKDDRRKKKVKKPAKEKKWKSKSEEIKGVNDNHRDSSVSVQPVSPLTFESVSLDDSHLSDIRLDEEIAKEARRLEQELLAASEETSTFGDEEPTTKKEEKLPERKFEEEAAKETKRLEAELFATGRESWHIKEKPFGPDLHPENLCHDSKHRESGSLVMKDESIFASLALHSSLGDASQHESDLFLSAHSGSDPYKLEDKDASSEIDDQRKIEDDLAVSALLQEMNNGDISAPELTKETDYLEPLMSAQPDDTMNYLLRDESDNSLHIVDHSPELLVNENSDVRLENDVIALSPSSNSEPPSLEISNFEDSLALKSYHDSKPVPEEVAKSEIICESISNKSVIENRHAVHFECSSDLPEETVENKPPVIDIPSGTATLETVSDSLSPRSGKRLPRKRWTEQSPVLSSKETALHPVCDNSNEVPDSEQLENNPGEFEDITMDIKDCKDDDNPPVLLPVDLQPRLEATSESITKSDIVIASPKDKNEIVIPSVEIPPSSLSTSESVIVRAPEAEKVTESFISKPKADQNVTLSLADFEDSCGELAPLNISPFCSDPGETPVFKLTDVSKSSSETDGLVNSHINFETATSIMSESSSWRNSDIELTSLNTTSTQKIHAEERVPAKSPILYYPDIFPRSDNIVDRYEVKKSDTSVIKSTANISTRNLSPEQPKRSVVDVEQADSRLISTDNFLHNVFSPSKDTRGVVIFNTSQLSKEKNNAGIQHIFDYDQKYHDPPSVIDKPAFEKEKSPEKPEVTNNVSVVLNKDPFDSLQEAPKPLHFPPLFTIPTTEALLSPSSDKPASVTEENTSSYNDTESLQEQDQKAESESAPAVVEDEPSSKPVSSVQEPESEETVSLAETLSKIEGKLEGEDNMDKKSRGADVESVSSDTTDIAFPDIKAELEMNQLTSSEEQVQDEPCIVEELKVEEKPPKSERPRRGRRPKTRKYTESVSKNETHSDIVPNPVVTKSRRARPTSFERTRRSLRSDTIEQSVIAESKDSLVENKSETLPFCESEEETRKSVEELTSTDTTNCSESASVVYSDTHESKPVDKVYNTRSEESRRRRGRRKKSSVEHQNLSIQEKVDSKSEEVDHSKDFHRRKESRLWPSFSSEKEPRTSKETSSACDIFDFIVEKEDAELNIPRDLQSSVVKKRLHDSSKITGSSQDPKPDVKPIDPPAEKEKIEESKQKVSSTDDGDGTARECVTEVNQHKKISLTIRFHQKDGHDETAEVVKISETVNLEEPKPDPVKPEKSSKESLPYESSHTGPSKSTRKSPRIMNQTARSTMDEVIEEVAKGNFKVSSSQPVEVTASRVTRRSRANRKSEESVITVPSDTFDDPTEDKNKKEPMFVILDNTVKDVPDSKKSHMNQVIDTPPITEANSSSESDRNDRIASLRSYRMRHSAASKLDTQKETSVSETSHDSDSHKKENTQTAEEKKEPCTVSQQPKKESSASLPNTVRASLPVVKVELPRITPPSGKDHISSKVDKNEENEDDSDSGSHPIALIDPKTGFLLPVRQKDEPVEKVDNTNVFPSSVEAKITSGTSYLLPASTTVVASTKLSAKESKSLKGEHLQGKSALWDQTVAGRQALPTASALSGHPAVCSPAPPARKDPAPGHPATDVQAVGPPDALSHFMDLKSASNKPKSCAHVGVLTPVVSSASSLGASVNCLKTISTSVTCQSSAVCPSPSPHSPASFARTSLPVSSYSVRLSTGATTQGIVSTTTPSVAFSSISSPTSTHQPPLRTVVTAAVVTVASSEPSAIVPLKVQTKCHPSSPGLPLALSTNSRNEVSPLHANIVSPSASSNGSTTCSKGNSSDSLSASQHWNSSIKEISSASAIAVSNSSWSSSNLPSQISVASEIPAHLSAIQSNACHPSPTVGKSQSHINQAAYSHSSKSSAAYLQQAGFPASMYEAAQSGLQNLAVNNNGGVIAELLQNPQLLQQHKEYLAATASSSGRFQDRNQSQIVRPPTPVSAGIPPEVSVRLGNPTPPHTPTPFVSTSTHCWQQSPDVRNAHVAAGLHLLPAAAYPALGIPSLETRFPQLMFAPAHHPYPPVHHELHTQQEVRAAMSIPPRFAYAPIPPTVSSANFRQPPDSRFPHSDHKSDVKSAGDISDFTNERRTPDDKGLLPMKSMRGKKKEEKELKMGYCDDHERPGSGHEKHSIAGNTQSAQLHQDQFHHVKHYNTERELKPPVAHQPHVSTVPYSLNTPAHSAMRQQLLVVPRVGSPSRVHVDSRSPAQPTHTSSSYLCKKDTHLSQSMSSSDKQQIYEDISKKASVRPLSHQGASVPAGDASQIIQSKSSHSMSQSSYPMIPQNKQVNQQRLNAQSAAVGSDIANVSHPAHESEVTPQDDFIVINHPVLWQGQLELKNDNATVQMHFVSGDRDIADASLQQTKVKISQRMKLDDLQLEGVVRKLQNCSEHCILMALPCGINQQDVLAQSGKLKDGFIKYLILKNAAGIVNIIDPKTQQPTHVIHIFHPAGFASRILNDFASQLARLIKDITHLVVIITTV